MFCSTLKKNPLARILCLSKFGNGEDRNGLNRFFGSSLMAGSSPTMRDNEGICAARLLAVVVYNLMKPLLTASETVMMSVSCGLRLSILTIIADFSPWVSAWIDWNLSTPNVGNIPWDWSLFFGVACSMLWNDRNSWVFNKSSKLGLTLFHDICGYVRFVDHELKTQPPSYGPHEKREVHVRWKPPALQCAQS